MNDISLNLVSQEETTKDYENYMLPSRAPPSWLFGPVWAVLYVIIFLSYGYFVKQYLTDQTIARRTILPFIINMVLNLSFTYVQFGLDNKFLALIMIIIIWATIIATIVATYKKHRIIALLQIPYLLRVSFATLLQFNVRLLN